MRRSLAPLLIAMVLAVPSTSTAVDPAVHVAACDGRGATDTVKVKRIIPGGVTTVADTGVANCEIGLRDQAFGGVASDQDHVYFAWARTDGVQVRIGRVRHDGGGLDPSFISLASPIRNVFLSPVVAAGHLYAYVDNCTPILCVAGDLGTAKVLRIPVGGGTQSTVLTAPAGSNGIPFGVGYDGVYFVDTGFAWHAVQRVPLAGGAATTVFTIGSGPPAPDGFQNYSRLGRVANLVATPGATAYIGQRKTLVGETEPGIGTFDVAAPGSSYQQYGGAPLQDMNMWISALAPGSDGSAIFIRGPVDSGPWTIGRATVGKSPEYDAYPGAASTAPLLSLTSYPPWPAATGGAGSASGSGAGGAALDRNRIPPAITPRYRGNRGVPEVDIPCSAGPGTRLNRCQAIITVNQSGLGAVSASREQAKKPPKRVVIGRASKKASAAETITVRVRITNARARRALATRALRAQVALQATSVDGTVLTATDTVTLRKAARTGKK